MTKKENIYDVSIIIAVYNAEKYIDECIKSILDNDYEFDKIELILINDGSTDNSLEKCNEYAKQYKNITVIDIPNSGVSRARNEGLKIAKGKYIMILDSDDFISSNAIKTLVDFMDSNDVNIASYTLMYYIDGNIKPHYRNSMYINGTGVYNVDEYPNLNQATVNIIFKNRTKKIYYDEDMIVAEDEKFNTELIMINKKIGFCADVTYYYRQHSSSASKTKNNPYYCIEQLIKYWNNLIEKYQDKNGHVSRYIQSLILQQLKWRISRDELYPYYLDEKQFNEALEKIKNIVKHIDVEMIINKGNMQKYHKFYLINLRDSKINVELNESNFSIYADDILVEQAKRVAMYINKYSLNNNTLNIVGYVRSIILLYKDFGLYYTIRNSKDEIKKEKVDLFKSSFSCYKTKMEVTKIYDFNIDIDITNIKSLSFEIHIENNKYKINYEFSKYVPFNKMYRSFIHNGKIISYNKDKRLFRFKDSTPIKIFLTKIKKNAKLTLKGEFKVVIKRLLSKKYSKKEIWLYNDRDGIFDNAYYAFLHDFNKNDGIERYFIYDDDFDDIKDKFKDIPINNLVKYKSLKHVLLFISSSKIITSFKDITIYNPITKKMVYYRDLLKYKLIYLQHGILHSNLSKMYTNENNEIDKIIVSSHFEIENFINNYHYKESDLIKSGMPRLDYVDKNKKPKNKIVYAPTWRANLIGKLNKDNRRDLHNKQFLESKYYQEIDKLINSQELIKLLEDNNLIFEVKLHPIFKDYQPLFNSNSKNIKISSDAINLDEYKIFITDYSSFIFDYVYLNRPIIYFLPDHVEFKAGLHSYRELDLPLEKGFGPIADTSDKLVNEIKKIINNKFEASKKYQSRMNNFFLELKETHCDKLYEELIKEKRGK